MRSAFRHLLSSICDKFRITSTIEIYTDGSSKDGWGAWAYVISRTGKRVTENSKAIRRANSNTMEFQAAIEALKSLPENSKVILYSDSRILVDTMKSGVGPHAYKEQIEMLLQLGQLHKIQWQWIKAHNGNKWNERCDELCILSRNSNRS